MSGGNESASIRWWRRLGWLIVIWLLSVAALGTFTGILRLAMRWAGLTA